MTIESGFGTSASQDAASHRVLMESDPTASPPPTPSANDSVAEPRQTLLDLETARGCSMASGRPVPGDFIVQVARVWHDQDVWRDAKDASLRNPLQYVLRQWVQPVRRLQRERRRLHPQLEGYRRQKRSRKTGEPIERGSRSVQSAATRESVRETGSPATGHTTAAWVRRLQLQVMLRLLCWSQQGDAFVTAYAHSLDSAGRKAHKQHRKAMARKDSPSGPSLDMAHQRLINDIVAILSLAAVCLTPIPAGDASQRGGLPGTLASDGNEGTSSSASPTTVTAPLDNQTVPMRTSVDAHVRFEHLLQECCQVLMVNTTNSSRETLSMPPSSMIQYIYDQFELRNPFATRIPATESTATVDTTTLSPLPKRKRKRPTNDSTRLAGVGSGDSTTGRSSNSSSSVTTLSSAMVTGTSEDGTATTNLDACASILTLSTASSTARTTALVAPRAAPPTKRANSLLGGSSRRFTGSHFHTDLSNHAFQQVVAPARTRAISANPSAKGGSVSTTQGGPPRVTKSANASRLATKDRVASNQGGSTDPLPVSNILAPSTPCGKRSQDSAVRKKPFIVAETPQPVRRFGPGRRSLQWMDGGR